MRQTGQMLELEYGIDIANTTVATSTMTRAIESAQEAGFSKIVQYELLDEIYVPKTYKMREILDAGIVIEEARLDAEALLNNPPKEQIWFGHAYLIASVCDLIDFDDSELRFLPRFGEIRELSIPQQ